MPTHTSPSGEALARLWLEEDLPSLPLNAHTKLAVISDLHLGNGGYADDACNNARLLFTALCRYSAEGYTVVLLGDIEELWQFDLHQIVAAYDSTIYAAMRVLSQSSRLLRVFGNHDIDWQARSDPATNATHAIGAAEAVKLTVDGRARLLLVHGHQGTADSDKYSWISRFAVRAYGRTLEPVARWLGLQNPSEPRSSIARHYEQSMYDWARDNRVVLVCGHSHRAFFQSVPHAVRLEERIEAAKAAVTDATRSDAILKLSVELEGLRAEYEDERRRDSDLARIRDGNALLPCYFNTGCGIYRKGMTAIEIEGDELRAVKWSTETMGRLACRDTTSLGAVLDAVGVP